MGLTKEYLRYVPAGNFNIIASQNCNVAFVTLEGQEGRYVAVGACEHIIVWDLRLGEKAQVLTGEKAVVTFICPSPNKRHLAAGYSDGSVKVYDLKSGDVLNIFQGHKSEVTALAYDSYGHKLASGAKDTDIVVWDTVAESGLCRLTGHRGVVTQLQFMSQKPVLLSSSKDTFIKFWDLETHHCFKTLTGHMSEVWSIVLAKNDQYLITGCGDGELRVFKLFEKEEDNKSTVEYITATLELFNTEEDVEGTHPLQAQKVGSLLRSGRGRVVSMFSDPSGQIVGCHGTDMQIELFHFLPDVEAKNRMKKRLKKQRKKENKSEEEPMDTSGTQDILLGLKDEVRRLSPIKLGTKPKSLHLVMGNGDELRVAVSLMNNSLELHTLRSTVKDAQPLCLRTISSQGHRSEVRAVCFSSDNVAIASGSGEAVKLWNRSSQACLRTVETGYVVSLTFVPGDRHVLAGLKDGKLLIVDISVGDILEEIPAHEGELWSICLTPDLRGCASGGGDKTVKFWKFELITDERSETKSKVLSLLHTRTLELEETVLCVKISPNSKFVAVALLDTTIKIFFLDTFKFYLSLYGHKLPVICMDISWDSKIIATGSADRNVKIWGMDFGDCHKSIFAHDDSVTGLQFVPKTHYFFTCGKDGKVKEWDGDGFNRIITLQGHHNEAWALAVSPNGNFIVSSGHDRVLRLYEKSDQPLVLEDEQEEEREQQELATGEQTFVPGHEDLNLPSKKTVGSEVAAESILECLEVCEKYKEQLAEHEALQTASTQLLQKPTPPPLMVAFGVTTTDDFLLETLKRIRSSDLEEALLLLPFSSVCEMLQSISPLIARGDNTELLLKVLIFLLKLHHAPLMASHNMLKTLKKLKKLASERVKDLRDLVGYNYYGMLFLQQEVEAAEGVQLFRDATKERKKNEKQRREREKLKRSIVALTT